MSSAIVYSGWEREVSMNQGLDQLKIPLVDMDALDRKEPKALSQLEEALGTYGLAHLQGHRVNTQLLEQFYQEWFSFTQRPLAEKEKLSKPEIWFQRGWTPPNTEQAVIAGGKPDFKECYFATPFPHDPLIIADYPEICAENVWPNDSGSEFKTSYLSLSQGLHHAGERLLRGCEEILGLSTGNLVDRIKGGAHVTRALRYIALTEQQLEEKVLWGEEHTDFNLLTLLPGGRFYNDTGERAYPDGEFGLYLRTRGSDDHPEGHRVRGNAPPGAIIAQVGQQLEILSAGRFLATPHEVLAPPYSGLTRCATAHFIHLHPHQLVRPLTPFANEVSLARYRPPALAGTYSLKTLVDIGLAPKGTLERLGYSQYERLISQRQREGRS